MGIYLRAALGVCLLALLAACGHMGEVHPAREPVRFEGMEFKVNSTEYRYSPMQVSGRQVSPEGVFVVVELTLRNSYSSSVPAQFQPRFTLVDSSGADHAPESEATVPPKGPAGELAAQTVYVKRLIFDVPEGAGRLRVFTPVVVRSGPDGKSQGRYFFFDLKAAR